MNQLNARPSFNSAKTSSSSSCSQYSSSRLKPRNLKEELEKFKNTCGLNACFVLRREKDDTKGGFRVNTMEAIPMNSVVLEYLGDVINKSEADRRARRYSEMENDPGVYILECEGTTFW